MKATGRRESRWCAKEVGGEEKRRKKSGGVARGKGGKWRSEMERTVGAFPEGEGRGGEGGGDHTMENSAPVGAGGEWRLRESVATHWGT